MEERGMLGEPPELIDFRLRSNANSEISHSCVTLDPPRHKSTGCFPM
jgi:hypothetical protein